MLAANAVESATAAFVGDAVQFRNDVATSAPALVNAAKLSPTNTPTTASAANPWSKVGSVLLADWQQTQQAWVHLELAVLSAYDQEFVTLLTGLGVIPNAQKPALNTAVPQPGSGSGSGSGSNTGHSTPETANPTPSTPLNKTKTVGSGSGLTSDNYATTVPPVTVPDPTNQCNCGCPNIAGSLMQNGSSVSQDAIKIAPPIPRRFIPAESTTNPVRYADGVVTIAETDRPSRASSPASLVPLA